ncbi:MAG: phytanoyl-CoA dioxygenase, partial [Myxococcales bacterium]|nr:phytanoyl-CoA dioxygenase [Myxococcales bacterium]
RAGEMILVHTHVWHRSARSTTGKPRRALTVCYMDAATRCLRKKRAPRSFFRVFEREGP